jgi:hypothetical protein
MAVKVAELINDIQTNHKQVSASQKDEVRVMQAMLNDPTYEVGVYSTKGQIGVYNPAKDFRVMQTNIISSVTKISKDEASQLVEGYEVTKSDANTMINISKEFVNTYLDSGRKMSLGGREKSNFTLSVKTIPRTEKVYQQRTVADNGEVSWKPGSKIIPEHKGLKARSSCPDWVK